MPERGWTLPHLFSQGFVRANNPRYRGGPAHIPQLDRVLARDPSFLPISNFTSSGRHMGTKLQSRQRTAIFPSSGGGGVSSKAILKARSIAAYTLARNSGVK